MKYTVNILQNGTTASSYLYEGATAWDKAIASYHTELANHTVDSVAVSIEDEYKNQLKHEYWQKESAQNMNTNTDTATE